MKKLLLLLLFLSCLFFSKTNYAQISYNGVILNTDESLLKDESVTLRIKIRENDPSGNSIFEEEHTTTTNKYGIFYISIGEGNGNDDFNTINWGKGEYYVETALKTNADSSFRVLGVTKLAYAPLALYAKNAGVFKTENNVTSNINGNIRNDDFVFGSSQLDYNSSPSPFLSPTRMFFDKSKGAFRTGYSLSSWNEGDLGLYSFAVGRETKAKGVNSAALGSNTTAIGLGSIATGLSSFTFGNYSSAMGSFVTASSFGQTTIGTHNTNRTAISSVDFRGEDALFVIGNGISSKKSDALVMLKNGNTELNGTFTIDASNNGTGYTLPTAKGTENQVLTANADGTTSWKDAVNGGAGIFQVEDNVVRNTNGDIANDDFVFGSSQLDDSGNMDEDAKMFFDKSKGVFRAGYVSRDQWDEVNLGFRSFATGYNTLASAIYATAMGFNSTASGSYSTSMGYHSTASGFNSTVMGHVTEAKSAFETTIGRYNTDYTPTSVTGWNELDRLFIIGNGTDNISRSDALVMLKNGNTELNGTFTIDASNDDTGYTLPTAKGTENQVLTANADGTTSWKDAINGGAGIFQVEDNVVRNTNGDIANDDFVFGSDQLDYDGLPTHHSKRFFFDKSKAAFRAGNSVYSNWNEDNLGQNSTAFGFGTTASGAASFAVGADALALNSYSVAMGYKTTSSGLNSFASGLETSASGDYSTALGQNSKAIGNNSFVLGTGLQSTALYQTTIGAFNTVRFGFPTQWFDSDPIFVIGNGESDSDKSDALVMLKNGNTELNGTFTIDASNNDTGYTLPTQKGTENQVLTANADGTTSWKDASSGGVFQINSGVVSNANGNIATDDFVFGATQLDDDESTTADNGKMFFNKTKRAFRAGFVHNEWNNENLGKYSFASGYRTSAKGNSSVALGDRVTAPSFAQTTIGRFNITRTPISSIAHRGLDPLFIIGNGLSTQESDALVMLKNGNTELNGTFTIDASNDDTGYTLPTAKGTENQVLTANSDGTTSWKNFSGGEPSVFQKYDGVVTNVTLRNIDAISQIQEDFVIGSYKLDYSRTLDNPYATSRIRMFFDSSKAAFRVGSSGDNLDWNESNIGEFSFATGNTTRASGENSFAAGFKTKATGYSSFAMGSNSNASGDNSFVFGKDSQSIGFGSVVLGTGLQSPTFYQTTIGAFNTVRSGLATLWFESDPIFVIGNGTGSSASGRSDAFIVRKSGNTEIYGKLTIDAGSDDSRYSLPIAKGTENQVLTANADGTTSWKDVSAQGSDSQTYTVGFNADLGGYVAYVTPNGKHGVVVAMTNQGSTSVNWASAHNRVSWPSNFDENGQNFTDWRLPSQYEMTRYILPNADVLNITSHNYWTNQESLSTVHNAMAYNKDKKLVNIYFEPLDILKGSDCKVRAVRSF